MKDKENKKIDKLGDVKDISDSILFEDNHLLAVDKPFGMPTQEDRTGDLSIFEAARDYIKEMYKGLDDPYLRLVHRLDRPVGGVILFARTPAMAKQLSEMFRERSVRKTYLARIDGKIEPHSGELVHTLLKSGTKMVVVPKGTPKARDARLLYRTLEDISGEVESLVEIDLITGRRHQIRAQFSAVGSPIRGDIKYGSKEKFSAGAIALFSKSLTFFHPASGEEITISVDPPDQFLSTFENAVDRPD